MAEPVALARLYGDPEQRGLGWIRRETADGYRAGGVEPVILEDYNWTWFAGVVLPSSDGPDLTALHSVPEMASMKS
jgi:hypothetical protein